MVKWLIDVDTLVLLSLRRWQPALLTRLMRTFTRLGDTSTWTLIVLVLLAAGGDARRSGLLVGLATTLASLVAQLVKRTCQRPRPSAGICGFISLIEIPDAWSFPSGHTAASTAAAFALVGAGANLGPLIAGLAVGIGVSRMYLGAHYPLDVAAGALIGAVCGMAAVGAVGLI